MPASPLPSGNLKSLQILRAVAATAVVYCHIDTTPDIGTFGVDIFFVLSGFVMAMVIANGQRPYEFAMSRVARIVPMYWLLTTALLLVAWLAPGLLNSTTADLGNYARSLAFVPYFKENGELHPMLAVGWTLNYEMLFYACVLAAIVLVRRFYLPATLLLMAALYLAGASGAFGRVTTAFLGNALVAEFAFGMLVFEARRRQLLPALRPAAALTLALAAFVYMAWVEQPVVPGRFLQFGIPAALMLVALVSLEAPCFASNPAWVRVLARIGDASYATYLSHTFVVEGIRKVLHQKLDLLDPYGPVGVVVVIGLALAVGQLLYELLDRPLSAAARRLLIPGRRVPEDRAGLRIEPYARGSMPSRRF